MAHSAGEEVRSAHGVPLYSRESWYHPHRDSRHGDFHDPIILPQILHGNEWWFSVVDVIETLTDSAKPSVYWSAMKVRVHGDDGIQLSTICKQLKLQSSDGKMRLTDVSKCGTASAASVRFLVPDF